MKVAKIGLQKSIQTQVEKYFIKTNKDCLSIDEDSTIFVNAKMGRTNNNNLIHLTVIIN